VKAPGKSQREQFEKIALPHLRALYGVARQMVGSEKADDLVQETFLKAWKYFASFDPATNCRAWLFRILRNAWVNAWHKDRLGLPVASVEEAQLEPYYDWEGDLLKTSYQPAWNTLLLSCRLKVEILPGHDCSLFGGCHCWDICACGSTAATTL